MSIADSIRKLQKELPENVCLVAVSKFHNDESIMQAYDAGQRVFGESRVQEFISKKKTLPKDIIWHFIGHLQRNKVKDVILNASLIESVDSERLLQTIINESEKLKIKTRCLLQIHIAKEETKFGLTQVECENILSNPKYRKNKFIEINGLMAMATFTDDESVIKSEFKAMKDFFKSMKMKYFEGVDSFSVLSMGMSDDYMLAIECGSTNVRIGTSIFGVRS